MNAAQAQDADAGFLRALERRRAQALLARDLPALQALHAPDYELLTPSGRVFSRERYLAAIGAAPFYAGRKLGEMAVRLAPAMVLIRYPA